jgi:DNA repair exonuclease SbcCD ATPase subunit
MLKKLILDNFKSHAHTIIDFTPGLNVIVGENGSGKSSIFQAIGIGLFNSIHAMKNLVKDKQSFATIEIWFEHGGKCYKSIRSFGSYSSWQIFEDFDLVADGEKAVTIVLSQLFGLSELMDLPTFFNELLGVGQFNMVAPFAQSPGPRKQFFNRVLGVDEYDLTNQNLRVGERYGEEAIQTNEVELARLQVEQEYYQKAMLEKVQLETKRADLLLQLSIFGKTQNELAIQLDELDQEQTKYNTLKLELEKLNRDKEYLSVQLNASIQLLEFAEAEFQEVEDAISILPKLEAEVTVIKQIEKKNFENQHAYDIGEAECNARFEELNERKERLYAIEECPICGTKISNRKARELLSDIEQQIMALEFPSNIQEYAPEYPVNLEVTRVMARGLKKVEQKLAKRKEEVSGFQQQLDIVEAEIKGIVLPVFDEESYKKLVNDHTTCSIEVARANSLLDDLYTRLDKLEKLPDPGLAVDSLSNRLQQQKNTLETLKSIRSVFKQLGPVMAGRLLEQINYEAKIIFYDLLGEHYNVEVSIDADYGIETNIDGNSVSFYYLSGGQQVCLALAIRLALLKAVSGLDLMLIDEPFDSLDNLSKEAVVKALSNLAIEQFIIITHDDSFDADNLIKLELKNGISEYLQ